MKTHPLLTRPRATALLMALALGWGPGGFLNVGQALASPQPGARESMVTLNFVNAEIEGVARAIDPVDQAALLVPDATPVEHADQDADELPVGVDHGHGHVDELRGLAVHLDRQEARKGAGRLGAPHPRLLAALAEPGLGRGLLLFEPGASGRNDQPPGIGQGQPFELGGVGAQVLQLQAGAAQVLQTAGQLGCGGQALNPFDVQAQGLDHAIAHDLGLTAQAAAVDGRGAQRAATERRVRRAAVEIGNRVAVDESQRGVGAEELDHARRGFQEGAGAGFVKALAEFVAQVGQRFVNGFDDAGGHRQRVARQPHPAARPGGGAAELRVFLGHDDFQTQLRGGHGSRQAARTGADDQHIAMPRRSR